MNLLGNIDTKIKSLVSSENTTNASIVLGLYALFVAPHLPYSVAKVVDNLFVKVALIALILHIVLTNTTVGILAGICLVVTLMTVDTYKVNKEKLEVVSLSDTPVIKANGAPCTCGKEQKDCKCDEKEAAKPKDEKVVPVVPAEQETISMLPIDTNRLALHQDEDDDITVTESYNSGSLRPYTPYGHLKCSNGIPTEQFKIGECDLGLENIDLLEMSGRNDSTKIII